MVAATSVPLTSKSQETFVKYYNALQDMQNITRADMRTRFEFIDKTYQRELNSTTEQAKAVQANRQGDVTRYQDMTVPIVMPQIEAAVTHQAAVFLSQIPIFGIVAPPAYVDEGMQLETIFEENSIRGGWARQLLMFFRDGFKYNFAPILVDWANEVSYSVETNLDKNMKQGTPKEILWSGNRLKRLDPYNIFLDTRVPATELYKSGDWVGWTEYMSRLALKSFIASLPDKIIANIKPAFESGLGSSSAQGNSSRNFYIPTINANVTEPGTQAGQLNWLSWAGLGGGESKIAYKDGYEVTHLYSRILPSEFGLKVPNANTPQIYKLILVNHTHIIYAELQTNAHNYLPVLIGQPLEDGLSYQTKSVATNGTPFQELATAYMSSIIASRRRAIGDRVLFDPSRITQAHIDSPNPSAKIPVRPAAYGKNISDSVYAFPYREDQQAASMQQIQTVIGLGNQLTGQNPVSQGQFVKGNKTNQQFDEVMTNASGRDQMAALLLEYQVFVPMKEILRLNTMQYQSGTILFNRNKQVEIEIDPVALRKAVLNFKVSDGLVPSEELLDAEAFRVALEAMTRDPELRAGYNVNALFSYLLKSQGADIAAFEKSPEQVAYEQALNSWTSLAQLLIEKGGDPAQLPPQPLPEQFNYDPKTAAPTKGDEGSATTANNAATRDSALFAGTRQ